MSNVSVSKRGNYWQYRFYTVVVNGVRKQISKSGFRTKKEALEAGNEALNKYLNVGAVTKPTQASVSDIVDRWYEKEALTSARENSLESYRNVINRHLKPRFGHYLAKDITTAMVTDFLIQLRIKGYAKTTSSSIVSVLSKSYTYAIKEGIALSNPCKNLSFPKFEIRKPRNALTEEEFQRIIEMFPEGNYWHLPIMIGYHTGMRLGEILALTWNDVDLENGVLSVNKKLTSISMDYSLNKTEARGKQHYIFDEPKTRKSVRDLYIDSELLDLLKREKARQEQERARRGKQYIVTYIQKITDSRGNTYNKLVNISQDIPVFLPEANLVCRRDTGSFLTKNAFRTCSSKIQFDLKITFSSHMLRHTHATILVQEGANIKDVQERMGHSTPAVTMNVYAHNTDKNKRQSVALFEKFLENSKK